MGFTVPRLGFNHWERHKPFLKGKWDFYPFTIFDFIIWQLLKCAYFFYVHVDLSRHIGSWQFFRIRIQCLAATQLAVVACPQGLFVFWGHHIEKREDAGTMGMRYARLRVTEIKMEPDLYFGSVPPGLYALWLNNNDAGEASLQRRFVKFWHKNDSNK